MTLRDAHGRPLGQAQGGAGQGEGCDVLAGGAIDTATDIAGSLCANDQILKNVGGTWTCTADNDSGSTAWNEIGNATGAGDVPMGEYAQSLDWVMATDAAPSIEPIKTGAAVPLPALT